MSSLRLRIFVLLFAATLAVWSAAAVWTWATTRSDIQRVLDRRLVEAAGMVASLAESTGAGSQRPTIPSRAEMPEAAVGRQLSCQIWTLDWRLIGRSEGAPSAPLAQGRPGFTERMIDGERWRVYTLVERRSGLRILVGDNLRVRQNLVGDVLTGLLLPAVVGLLALALALWSAVGRGLLPLNSIARELSFREPGDTRPLTSKASAAELRPLMDAINGLFSRLEYLRASERHFIASAAHELQTPLAGLRAHAQIASTTSDEAARRKSLRSIELSVDRTSQLVQQLLDLAREEASSAALEPRWVSLRAIADAAAEELAQLCRDKRVRVQLDAEASDVELCADEGALILALRNLVKNGVEHSPAESTIEIFCVQKDQRIELVIADQGPGVAKGELSEIRKRFVRGAGVRGPGSGLGLSIVEAALERIGARLILRNGEDAGLEAVISIPAERVRRVPAGT